MREKQAVYCVIRYLNRQKRIYSNLIFIFRCNNFPMKNQHKAKGYKLESKMQKSAFLEFKRQFSPKIENLKILEIQKLQEHSEQSDWLGTYIVKPNPQIEKYLIQCQIKDLSYISSLNKIDRFLNNQQSKKVSAPKKEDEKIKKHHSQSTEVQSN